MTFYNKMRLIVTSKINSKKIKVHDRRTNPSNGYRAIHLVASQSELLIEVQLRTHLQHLWAELSEKISNIYGPEIKYGHSSRKDILSFLSQLSKEVMDIEQLEKRCLNLRREYNHAIYDKEIKEIDRYIRKMKSETEKKLQEQIKKFS